MENQLLEALGGGLTNFTYVKSDGTLREAQGTTNPEIAADMGDRDLEYMKTALANVGAQESGVVRYFDVKANGLRSFKVATAQLK